MALNGMEYDPYDLYYKGGLKNQFRENTTNFYEKLAKEANIDKERNKEIVNEVNKLQKKIDDVSGKLGAFKFLKVLLIILIIGSAVSIIIGIFAFYNEAKNSLLVGGLCLGIGIAVLIISLLLLFLVVNKKCKNLNNSLKKLENKKNSAINEGRMQLLPLLGRFSFKDFINLVNGMNINIKLDDKVDQKKLLLLSNLFHYNSNLNIDECVFDCISGNIDDNPFLRVQLFNRNIINKTYTGTRVITWTETYRDGQGNLQVRTESDTLVAHYTAPAAVFYKNSFVIYGNEAAPNLSFLRTPSGLELNHDKKDVEKIINKNYKKLKSLSEKTSLKGNKITLLANEDFEGLFNCTDRDNEVEYRLLFTPLAQQNLVEVITSATPYGDDFSFKKMKKLNIVSAKHSQHLINFDYQSELFFFEYDYERLTTNYINKMCEAFESLYFDLIPLLCIPLYQMSEPEVYDPIQNSRNVSDYEAESLVNHSSPELFRNTNANTEQILKVKYLDSIDGSDIFSVNSQSYNKVRRVEQIPCLCRNGQTYLVPVVWYEFIPFNRDTKIAIRNINDNNLASNNNQNNNQNIYRYKNFAAYYLNQNNLNEEENKLFKETSDKSYTFYK